MAKDTQQTIITDPETNTEKVFTFDYRSVRNCALHFAFLRDADTDGIM